MINPPEAEPAIPPITLAATESSGLSRALRSPPGLCYPAETTFKRWAEFGRFRSHRGWGRTGYDTQIRDGSRRRSSDFCRLAKSRQRSRARWWLAWRWLEWRRVAWRRVAWRRVAWRWLAWRRWRGGGWGWRGPSWGWGGGWGRGGGLGGRVVGWG